MAKKCVASCPAPLALCFRYAIKRVQRRTGATVSIDTPVAVGTHPCVSLLFFWFFLVRLQYCCGIFLALVFILIPFVMGATVVSVCGTIKESVAPQLETCANSPSCAEAFNKQVESVCAIGNGMTAASVLTLFCVLLSVVTSLLTCIGFCTQKQSGQNSNATMLVMEAESTEYKPI